MRFVRGWMVFLTLAVVGLSVVAQEDAEDDQKLIINNIVDNPILCTHDQATTFYESLDGFQQSLNNIALVKNTDTLQFWLNIHKQWFDETWALLLAEGCHGAKMLIYALRAVASHNLLEHMIGDVGEIPAQDVMRDVRDMAVADLEAIKRTQYPESELQINLIITNLPYCSNNQAIAFYKTIDGYLQEMNKLILVDDWRSLRVWVGMLHAWRQEAWTSFYDQPCGIRLAYMFWIERLTYINALVSVVSGETPNIDNLIRPLRDTAAKDLAVIEAMTSE
ncbi:MAG: hypothetical protein OXE52_00985 [Chloroflexi bacterium]|nr:hypothetical protein [Chloroflexota bacterium]